MPELGIYCVRRAVSGAGLTDFGKAACVSLLLVLSCALSPAFAQASEGDGCTPEMKVKVGSGSKVVPYEIRTLCQLQDISSIPTAHYVLMDDIDASTTVNWNDGAGFRPIASTATDGFSGSFVNASKHVISSLTISRSSTDNVGLFSRLAKNGKIEGIRLVGSRITGPNFTGSLVGDNKGVIENSYVMAGSVFSKLDMVGGLVGINSGNIRDSYATGSVDGRIGVGGLAGYNLGRISGSSATGSVSGIDRQVGGLVGFLNFKSVIIDSYATGSVSGVEEVGGLVGGSSGDISDSYATGLVSGSTQVGGLVGSSDSGDINNSHATGSVSGAENAGGLVGRHLKGNISNSYATGLVSGDNQVGGLIGLNQGNISDSYATGSVSGRADNVGGLIGENKVAINVSNAKVSISGDNHVSAIVGLRRISGSYATGSVSGDNHVGGLVGLNQGNISDSYATGSASGRGNNVGGLVGFHATGSRISNGYATGSVSGNDPVGGLVGSAFDNNSGISNSYYAARGQNSDLGTERTFTQLRCPATSSATCSLSGSDQRTYEDWDTNVWDFGSTTELPQLSSNRNSELNLKPYINGSADLVVVIGFTGITQFSLVADYLGPSGEFVILTWSLSGVPTSLRHLVYFDLEGGTTSTTFTDSRKLTDGASTAMLVVVGHEELSGRSFYVVLKNNISANDDRIRVRTEVEQPYIRQDGIRQARAEGTTTLSFSVANAGPAEQPVTLTWSLSGVPTPLRHLVYFDLGNDATSTTVTDSGKLTGSASPVTLVVVGNKELAGRSFYVVLKNNVSANDDRVRVQVEGEPPNLVRDDDIRPALVGRTTTFSFSVGYTGSSVPVTLTWSLEDVPISLRHLVYFDLGGGTTSITVTDSGKLTGSASTVTLVVVGNEELAGRGFYVVLKNNFSASDDRVQVRTEVGPPNIARDDDIRPIPIGSTTTFGFSVGYTGSSDPVTLTWSLSGVPSTLRHLVYFDLEGGTTSTTVTDSAQLTGSASTVTLVIVGDEGLEGRSFYVVLKNNVSDSDARVKVQVEGDPPEILGDDGIRTAPIGRTTTFSFSVGYTGSPVPATLTWSLEDVPISLRHLVYFVLADGSTSTTFTDGSVRTNNASTATLVVVGNKELAGRSFYVVLKNNVSDSDDRVKVQVEGDPPEILGDDRLVPIGRTTIISFSVGYTGSPVPVTLTWSLLDVPSTLSHLVYFDLAGNSTSTTFTDPSVLTSGASMVTLVVVGDEGLADRSFYVVLRNNVSGNVARVMIQVRKEDSSALRVKVYLGGAVR